MGCRWSRWGRWDRWAGGESETSWLTAEFVGGDCSCTFLLINHLCIHAALCGGPNDGMEAGPRLVRCSLTHLALVRARIQRL
jgi:hypothetical protein